MKSILLLLVLYLCILSSPHQTYGQLSRKRSTSPSTSLEIEQSDEHEQSMPNADSQPIKTSDENDEKERLPFSRPDRASRIEKSIESRLKNRRKHQHPDSQTSLLDHVIDNQPESSKNRWLKDLENGKILPYHINVGRRKWFQDVVKDGLVNKAYSIDQTVDTGRDVDDASDYYIWRTVNEPTDSSRAITVQKPIVFIDNPDIITATIEEWGTRSMRRLPPGPSIDVPAKTIKNNTDYLSFSLSTVCKSKGETMLTITLRTFEMTSKQRSKDKLEWRVRRTCEEGVVLPEIGLGPTDQSGQLPVIVPENATVSEASAESSIVKGFGVTYLQSKRSRKDVLIDGKPTNEFKPRAASNDQTNDQSINQSKNQDETAAFKIDETMNRMDFSMVYASDRPHKLAKPVIFVEHPDILTVGINWRDDVVELQEGLTIPFALSFSCLNEGSTAFTVMFTFPDDTTAQVTFGAIKVCKGQEQVVGVAGSMIDVGVGDRCSEEIVNDGETQSEYRSVARWTKKAWKDHAKPIGESTSSLVFCVSTSNPTDSFAYGKPQITAFTQDGRVIGTPVLGGSIIDEATPLSKSNPVMMSVDFRCTSPGVMGVSISIPFKQVGNIQWTLRKECSEESVVATEESPQMFETSDHDGDQTSFIPGLNLGFSRSQHGQMFNGVVSSIYRLQNSTRDLAFCEGKRQFLSFYLYQNSSVTDAMSIQYGTPELISTNQITSPLLSGDVHGGVVNSTAHASFTITFRCQADGDTMFTLRIPLLPLTLPSGDVEAAPRPAVVIQFVKACNSSDRAWTVEAGGVGIQGFRIGKSPNASDPESQSVVSDGFPTVPYFGQKDRDDPDWNGVIVPEDEVSTRLYLSYVGGDNIGQRSVPFSPPRLIAHSSYFKPELSGPATRGGRIRKNTQTPPYLDITYNCLLKGLLTLNILVPVEGGSITFTIPKQCAGPSATVGSRVYPGLMIGITPGGHEVVEDGLVQPLFSTALKGRGFSVDAENTMTTFYMTQQGGTLFQAIEPLARAISPSVWAELEHDMYVSKGPAGELYRYDQVAHPGDVNDALSGDENAEHEGNLMVDEIDDVYLDERIATLNISYNCMSEGSSLIQVSMPLKVGYIDWTWTKLCPTADFFDHPGQFGRAGIVPGGSQHTSPSHVDQGDHDDAEHDDHDHDHSAAADNDDDAPPSEDLEANVLPGGDFPGGAARVVPGGSEIENMFGDDEDDIAKTRRLIEESKRLEEFNAVHENNPEEEHLSANDFNRLSDLVIATTSAKAKSHRADVFGHGRLNDRYKHRSTKDVTLDPSYQAVISADTTTTTFYLSTIAVAEQGQSVGKPNTHFPSHATHAHILDVKVGGPLVDSHLSHTSLFPEDEPIPIVVTTTCLPGHGGTVPFIVTISLDPAEAGAVSLYMTKICRDTRDGAAQRKSSWTMYFLIAVIAACTLGGVWYYFTHGGVDFGALIDRSKKNTKNVSLERGGYEIVKTRDEEGN